MKHAPLASGTTSNLSGSVLRRCSLYPFSAGRERPRRRISETSQQPQRVALAAAVVLVALIVASQAAHAQTYRLLYSFKGPPDGSTPYASLIRDAAGNLYGTTYWGGVSYWGTAFKVDTKSKETVLYSFLGGYGQNPSGGLVRDEKGNFYGTTTYGGGYNLGTVFKLDKKGKETVLYNFTGSKGSLPFAGLVRDKAGNLYGTASDLYGPGYGTVFELNTVGKMSVLHRFTGGDGAYPLGGLLRDSKGNFYGTTSQHYGAGNGTVFEIDAAGKATVLYRFAGGADGGHPYSGLIRDAAGNLYGTTTAGGDLSCNPPVGCGAAFKLDKNHKLNVLHAFNYSTGDGAYPRGDLVRDPMGNLYGTTSYGGASGAGMVFRLDPTGKETVLYSFTGKQDGSNPQAGLILDDKGSLYGTTSGIYGGGTVFKLIP